MKIFDANTINPTSTSHDLDVYKKTIIKNGDIPKLTNFSIGYLKPKQKTSLHSHPTMYEIFYINKGSATFIIDKHEITMSVGNTIIIEPGEIHQQLNNTNQDCEWIYFGIAID